MFEFKSHREVKRNGELVGYEVNPYIAISAKGCQIAVQSGKFWSFGGAEIPVDELPQCVWDAIDTWSDETKRSVGIEKLKRPVRKVALA